MIENCRLNNVFIYAREINYHQYQNFQFFFSFKTRETRSNPDQHSQSELHLHLHQVKLTEKKPRTYSIEPYQKLKVSYAILEPVLEECPINIVFTKSENCLVDDKYLVYKNTANFGNNSTTKIIDLDTCRYVENSLFSQMYTETNNNFIQNHVANVKDGIHEQMLKLIEFGQNCEIEKKISYPKCMDKMVDNFQKGKLRVDTVRTFENYVDRWQEFFDKFTLMLRGMMKIRWFYKEFVGRDLGYDQWNNKELECIENLYNELENDINNIN